MNDKLKKLYSLYEKKGLVNNTSFDKFSQASPEQQKKLYDLAARKGLVKDVSFDTFSSAFTQEETQALGKQEGAQSVAAPVAPTPLVDGGEQETQSETLSTEQPIVSPEQQLKSLEEQELENIQQVEKVADSMRTVINDYKQEVEGDSEWLKDRAYEMNMLVANLPKNEEGQPFFPNEKIAKDYAILEAGYNEVKKSYNQKAQSYNDIVARYGAVQEWEARSKNRVKKKELEIKREAVDNLQKMLPLSQRAAVSVIGNVKYAWERYAKQSFAGFLSNYEEVTQEGLEFAAQIMPESVQQFIETRRKVKTQPSKEFAIKEGIEASESAAQIKEDYGLVTTLDEVDDPLSMLAYASGAALEGAVQIPLAFATGGSSSFIMSSGLMYQEILEGRVRQYQEEGMSFDEAVKKAAADDDINMAALNAGAGVVAALDLAGSMSIFKGSTKKAVQEQIKKVIETRSVAQIVKKSIKGTLGEVATETLQEPIEAGTVEAAKGDKGDGFIKGFTEMATDPDAMLDIAARSAFGAGGATIVAQVSSANPDVNKIVKAVREDNEAKTFAFEYLNSQVKNGKITVEKAESIKAKIDDDVAAYQKVKSLIPEDRIDEAIPLQKEWDNLQEQAETVSGGLKSFVKNKQKEVQAKLEQLIPQTDEAKTEEESMLEGVRDAGDEKTEGEESAELRAKEEVDTYIEDESANLGFEVLGEKKKVDETLSKMDNAENINDSEIDASLDAVFNEIDRVNKSDLSQQAKDRITEKLFNIAEQIDNYEFRTKTETRKTTERKTTTVPLESPTGKRTTKQFFDQTAAEVNGEVVKLSTKNDRVEAETKDGTIVIDTPTLDLKEDGVELDENGAFKSATFTDRLGNEVKFTGNTGLDLAIKVRENRIGTVPQALFENIYEEVERTVEVEVPYVKQSTQKSETVSEIEQTSGAETTQESQASVETAPVAKQEATSQEVESGKIGEYEESKETKPSENKALDTLSAWEEKLNEWDSDLKKFGDETLGINLPVAVARAAIGAARLAVKAGKTATEIYQSMEQAVKNSTWYQKQSTRGKENALNALEKFAKGNITLNDLTREEKKELKSLKSSISKKVKVQVKKLKAAKFSNKSLVVSEFLGSLSKLGQINDVELLQDVLNQLNDLAQRGVPKINEKDLNELTKKVYSSGKNKNDKKAIDIARQSLSALKQKIKPKNQPTDLGGLISFRLAIDKARNSFDNALANQEISEDEYSNKIDELNEIEVEFSLITPETANSYSALIKAKGNITRANTKIDEALENGDISEEKAKELKDGLKEAKEKYDQEVGGFIESNNESAKRFFKDNKAKDIAEIFNLPKPQFILLDKLFEVFRRGDVFVDDVALSNKLLKITEAIESGYFPLRDMYELYRHILSERNAEGVVKIIEGATKSFRSKSSDEIVRDFSATVLGFKSAKLGKEAKRSKKLEEAVYSPLLEAIEQSERESQRILKDFEKETGLSFFDRLNPFAKKKRRRDIVMAGVFMNQLNVQLQKGSGAFTSILIKSVDNSRISVDSIDWLGVILGKKEAINALEGNVNEKSRSSLLKGDLRKEYGSTDLKYMEEVWKSLPKKDDGSVDYDEFFQNSIKYIGKDASKLVSASNNAFSESFEYLKAAKFMRGQGIEEITGYYKRARLGVGDSEIDYRTMKLSDNMRVVAGSSIDRATQAVGAIDFNVLNTVTANAVESTKFFYFEINGGLVNSTLNKVIQYTDQKQVAEATKRDAKASIEHTYNSGSNGAAYQFLSKMVGAKYVESLLRGSKLVAEFLSMFLRMPLQTSSFKSIGYIGKTKTLSALESISGIEVTPNQSAQIEQGVFSSTRKRSRDAISAIKRKGFVDYINMAMGIAEIALRGGYVYPLFLKNFQLVTGEVFDSSKLKEENYVSEYREAISRAMSITKIENSRIYPTGSKFSERRKIKILPFVKAGYIKADTVEGRILNFMSSFVFKESETLIESARFSKDILAEEGFTKKSIKDATTQAIASREAFAAYGVLVGGFVYQYLTGLGYLLPQMFDDDADDDDREKTAELLRDQYGLHYDKKGNFIRYDVEKDIIGSLEMVLDQSSFFFIGRYGQSIRLMSIMSLSWAHGQFEKGSKARKNIERYLKNNFYTRPVSFNNFSLGAFASKNIPVVDMGINSIMNLAEVIEQGYEIGKKAVKGELDEDEKAFLKVFSVFFKMTNLALLGKGVQVPETRAISREIEEELKKETREQKIARRKREIEQKRREINAKKENQ